MWQKCKDLQEYLVNVRRQLHQIPELGNDLPETRAFVCAELDKMGIPYKLNTLDSGIVALIEGGKPGKVVALRADMDALPITEATGVDYASKHEGKMHACGHDNHMTMLLGAAKVLNENRDQLHGSVKLIFQTGEETATGAQIMLKENILENPHVDAIFGMHIGSIIDPNIPAGKVIVTPGCCMASYDKFVLRVTGVGCHGSTPEKGVDPVVAAANIVIALEEVVAREISSTRPAVLTIGQIHAGFAFNVIPNEVVIEGTTRALEEEVRQYLAKRIGEISSGIAASYRAKCELEMVWCAAPVVNDDAMAKFAADAAEKVVGKENMITWRPAPNMAGEDFSYFLMQRPGAYMFLSSSNHAKGTDVPHHNPKFNVDEDVLWRGSAVFVSIAEDYLGK